MLFDLLSLLLDKFLARTVVVVILAANVFVIIEQSRYFIATIRISNSIVGQHLFNVANLTFEFVDMGCVSVSTLSCVLPTRQNVILPLLEYLLVLALS